MYKQHIELDGQVYSQIILICLFKQAVYQQLQFSFKKRKFTHTIPYNYSSYVQFRARICVSTILQLTCKIQSKNLFSYVFMYERVTGQNISTSIAVNNLEKKNIE